MPAAWYSYPVTQAYGTPEPGGKEEGVDIGTPFNTPLTAAYGGTIVEAGDTHWPDGTTSGGLVGIATYVPGHGNVEEYYLHVDRLAPGIAQGAFVSSGQLIGYSGGQTSGGNWPASTSHSSGPHTEFGFGASFLKDPGRNFDPSFVLAELQGQGGQYIAQGAQQAVNSAQQAASSAAGDVVSAAQQAVNSALQPIMSGVTQTGVALGGVSLGAIAIIGGALLIGF